MIKELEIACKGLANASIECSDGFMVFTMQEVDEDFIENIPAEKIAKYGDLSQILEHMDSTDIITYLEKNYDCKVVFGR